MYLRMLQAAPDRRYVSADAAPESCPYLSTDAASCHDTSALLQSAFSYSACFANKYLRFACDIVSL